MHQPLDHLTRQIQIPTQVLDQGPLIDHRVHIEQPRRQIRLTHVIRARRAAQVIDHREVVVLGLLGVHRERVAHVQRCLYIGVHVSRHHAPEHRPVQSAGQGTRLAQRPQILRRPRRPRIGRRLRASGITPMCLGYLARLLGQIPYLRLAQQQRLPLGPASI